MDGIRDADKTKGWAGGASRRSGMSVRRTCPGRIIPGMVEINIAYQGDLRCEAVHSPSGTVLMTDAPVDNMGKGESFSPTDLVATALGSCILTILGILARRHGIDLSGSAVTVKKDMAASPVRRIGRLAVDVHVPAKLSDDQRKLLENAAHTCPVHKSLHPDVEMPITFHWAQ